MDASCFKHKHTHTHIDVGLIKVGAGKKTQRVDSLVQGKEEEEEEEEVKEEEASPASHLVRARRGLLCRAVLKIWIMTEEGRIQDSRLGNQK